MTDLSGSCLCGACRFSVAGPAEGLSVCHCTQCRKMSGYAWSSGRVPDDRITIEGPVALYEATPAATRGFCPTCGSSLFWKGHGEGYVSFALGALDGPTGLHLEKHIFTTDKGDYYEIADGLPQKP